MVGTLWLLDILVGSVSIALLSILLVVYVRNLRQLRSPFAVGLVLFALLFIAQNVVGIVSYMQMDAQGIGSGAALPMLYLNVVQAAAFGVLLYISWG